jgi:hypothetical protein
MQAINRKLGDAIINDDNEQFHCMRPVGAGNGRSLVLPAGKEKAVLTALLSAFG